VIPEHKLLERVTKVAPFGVRFWDGVTGSPVGEGLAVTLYPAADPLRRFRAVPNRTQVHVVYDLPGLRTYENGGAAGGALPFCVEVQDDERRFLPFRFWAHLPAHRLYRLECTSPPLSPGVPLFSTPNRAVPSGMAVLRADLWDAANQRPAAWAMVEVRVSQRGAPVRGLSDDQGRLTVIFPYPEPERFAAGSPATATGLPLEQQSWPVEIRAFYGATLPPTVSPDLCAVLLQPPARLWATVSLLQPVTGAILRYGQELVVRSLDGGPLPITPAGSPP
jgi:hypothetical protein